MLKVYKAASIDVMAHILPDVLILWFSEKTCSLNAWADSPFKVCQVAIGEGQSEV